MDALNIPMEDITKTEVMYTILSSPCRSWRGQNHHWNVINFQVEKKTIWKNESTPIGWKNGLIIKLPNKEIWEIVITGEA